MWKRFVSLVVGSWIQASMAVQHGGESRQRRRDHLPGRWRTGKQREPWHCRKYTCTSRIRLRRQVVKLAEVGRWWDQLCCLSWLAAGECSPPGRPPWTRNTKPSLGLLSRSGLPLPLASRHRSGRWRPTLSGLLWKPATGRPRHGSCMQWGSGCCMPGGSGGLQTCLQRRWALHPNSLRWLALEYRPAIS
jgi:hypothetical protein